MLLKENPLLKDHAKKNAWKTVLISLCVGMILTVPYIIIDKGYFFYYGDFNVQQVPFWQYAAENIKSGNLGWTWETDLGSALLPTYSFYMLGSPFFWLALIFPSSWMPALMGPLLVLKMTTASLGGYLLAKKYVVNTDYAVIAGLLYGFSSYTIYNIFFNHFIDVVAVFPFLILAFDELVEKGRWGYFALTTAICLLTNYFFFVGQVFFILIYYLARISSRGKWMFKIKTFVHIIIEAVIGVALSMFLMLPTYITVSQNPRLNSMFNGWGFYIYGETRRYMDILHSLLFPPELPHFTYYIEDGNTRWQSVAAWLPLIALTCIIAFMVSKKAVGSWQKKVLIFSGVALLMPGVGSIFYLLKSTYYSRWLYMPILIAAIVSVQVLERPQHYKVKTGFKWNAILTGLLFIPIAFLPVLNSDGNVSKIGLYSRNWNADVMFWICSIIAVGCVVAFYWLFFKVRKNKGEPVFLKYFTVALTAVICVYGLFILTSGKLSSEKSKIMRENSVLAGQDFQIPGQDMDAAEFYRIDVLDGMDNQGLFWRQSSINNFNSTVSPNIMNFYKKIGLERNVASRPDTSYKGLRALTSVKYVFQAKNKDSYTKLPNLTHIGTAYDHEVYLNGNYIPFGYTYDHYVTQERYDTIFSTNKDICDILLVNAIVLDENQVAMYGRMMELVQEPRSAFTYTDSGLADAAAARAATSAYNYRRSNSGFSVEIDLERDNLVFFSIAYDEGWTATVNGAAAPVEYVSNGLVAVPAKAGHCEIILTYETPGFSTGIIISIAALVVLAGLFVIEIRRNKMRRSNPAVYCADDIEGGNWDYIDDAVGSHLKRKGLAPAATLTADEADGAPEDEYGEAVPQAQPESDEPAMMSEEELARLITEADEADGYERKGEIVTDFTKDADSENKDQPSE